MSTPHKEKIIRVLQLFQTTDEKTPMNAVQKSESIFLKSSLQRLV